MAAPEKRRHRRLPESLAFGLAGGPLPPGAVATIRIVDISSGGVGFESSFPIPVGQSIEFEIPVPIRVRTRVLRVESKGSFLRYGGKFEQVKPSEKRVLKAYLKKKLETLGLEPLPEEEKDDDEA